MINRLTSVFLCGVIASVAALAISPKANANPPALTIFELDSQNYHRDKDRRSDWDNDRRYDRENIRYDRDNDGRWDRDGRWNNDRRWRNDRRWDRDGRWRNDRRYNRDRSWYPY